MIGVKELIARRNQVTGEVDLAETEIKAKMEMIIDDGLVESADRGLSWFTTTLNPKEINDEIRDLWYEYQEKFTMSKYDLIMEIVKKYRENGFRVSKEKSRQDYYKFEFLEPRPKLEPVEDPKDVSKDSVNEDGTVNTGSQTHFTTDGGTQTEEEIQAEDALKEKETPHEKSVGTDVSTEPKEKEELEELPKVEEEHEDDLLH